jgi:hypothetical protein
MIAFLVMATLGMINWQMFFAFLAFIVFFGYLNSIFAIYIEVATYNQYRRRKEIAKLILAALSEPFIFHPFLVWSAIRGYYDYFMKKKAWGEMTRRGFGTAQGKA